MQRFFVILLIFHLLQVTRGLFSTVECPPYSYAEILQFHEYNFHPLDCTLVISCTDPFGISKNAESSHCPEDKFRDDNFIVDCNPKSGDTCEMKLKVNLIKNWNFQSLEKNPCTNVKDTSVASLLPFPGNCSLFYKCDWGSAILFECPSNLYFNPQLQVCDWPWKDQCDSTWLGCPRPYPRCPDNYPQPLYLPHPHLCDHFYQCEWGIPRLQTCPTGLHFNPTLKICDWPYKAHCQIC